jgi:hypothetical protein
MRTEKSSQRGLTTAQQLARLGLTRFFSRGSGLTPSTQPAETGTRSSHGHGRGTEAGPVAELAWVIAETAQSCAYLAIELQILAGRSYDQAPTCPDSTYKRLSDSARIFRGLLTNMHEKLVLVNSEAESSAICVINEDLAEAILSMWVADDLITTVECMTKPASQETPDTSAAGGTK